MSWEEDQIWESWWWDDCTKTYGEETKQLTYAHRMGLQNIPPGYRHWPVYDMKGKSVLDIGGGPVSILLKTTNSSRKVVIDPSSYPSWVEERYVCAGIEHFKYTGEDYRDAPSQFRIAQFDECWIYNVLQHVKDPELIVKNARQSAKLIRLFEWVYTPVSPGHPHSLSVKQLREWLGGDGVLEMLSGENDCHGPAFYGNFNT